MNRVRFFIILLLSIVLMACKGSSGCENEDIENFDSFLGLDENSMETELKPILGDFTGGYYSEDNRQFIYNFFAIPDAPVSVVVNASSSKVETVIMEVLSLDENFERDLGKAIEAYNIAECDSRFFGMQKSDIISEMGEPTSEEVLEGNVTSIEYFTKDYKTSVNFKFYPEQQHNCSTVIVNWYH